MKANTQGMFGTFYLNNVEFALPIDQVQEVVNYPENIIPMPLENNFLLGVFNLRGMVIPIVSLKILLNIAENEEDTTDLKVAIVNSNGARVGYIFDSTSEIIRTKEDDVEYVNYENKKSNDVVKGLIHLDHGKRIIQIIDPIKMLNLENIPGIVQTQNTHESIVKKNQLKKAISFSVFNMNFCLDILDVKEILKIDKVDDSYFKSNLSMGVITLREQCIPIVSYSQLIEAAPQKEIDENSRVIIIEYEKFNIGLLVDSIANIFSYDLDEVNAVPLVMKSKKNLMKGAVSHQELGDVFLIDEKKIFSQDEILDITKGYKNIYSNTQAKIVKKNVRKMSYITFKVQQTFGIPISDIREIINIPEEITSTPGTDDFIEGVFNLRGKLVTVINTRKVYNLEESTSDRQNKILIFEMNNEYIGLVVDSVENIENVNEESKIPVPSLLTKKIREMYGNDIKEIVTYKEVNKDDNEKTMIVLNINSLLLRLTNDIMAA